MARLVAADTIAPSTYNPRKADGWRLSLVKLSLEKLGFVLPMYATPEGEILSGHQRHLVATEYLGWDQVPVETTMSLDERMRRNVNVLFNRGTNDMDAKTDTKAMRAELMVARIHELGEALPEKTGADRWRCLRPRNIAVKPLLAANAGKWRRYPLTIAERLTKWKIRMPLVVNADTMQVVNGIGRLQLAAKLKEKAVSCVFVSPEEHEFADLMLNFLSMDFSLHDEYRDYIRHNSFRRHSWSSYKFGSAYADILGKVGMGNYDFEDPAFWAYFRRRLGRRFLDMGAGHLARQSHKDWLKERCDIDFHAFEPYMVPDGESIPSVELSREGARIFLDAVAAGKAFNSIVAQAVLNSIPFKRDREYFLAICHSLASPQTVFYCTCCPLDMMGSSVTGKERVDLGDHNSARFGLDYEPNVTISEWHAYPKMQKFMSKGEFAALLRPHWRSVTVRKPGMLSAVCKEPRPVDFDLLAKALAFEFDVPYLNGVRLGMVDEALEAFSERLDVKLRRPTVEGC